MKCQKQVVLIGGKKRSGKDYFQNLLKEELKNNNLSSEIFSFQDAVKEILSIALGISTQELNELKDNNEEIHIGSSITNMRNILQRFSTEQMQNYFGIDVWINFINLKIAESKADVILIPDFRFRQEAISSFSIQILGGVVDKHQSENDLKHHIFKYVVDNTKQEDLSKEVKFICSEIIQDINKKTKNVSFFRDLIGA